MGSGFWGKPLGRENQKEMSVEKKVRDAGTFTESAHIAVFTAGGMIANINRLARMAAKAADESDRQCLVDSAFLNAGAALEAALMEYGYWSNAPAYREGRFANHSVFKKYRKLRPGRSLEADFPELVKIYSIRNGLMHHEAEAEPSRQSGADRTIENADRAYDEMLAFIKALFGNRLPPELRDAENI